MIGEATVSISSNASSSSGVYPEAAWRPSPLEPPVYAQCDVSVAPSRQEQGPQHTNRRLKRPFAAQYTSREPHVVISSGQRKREAYDDHYFSFEGEETVEVLELDLRFGVCGH